MKFKNYLDNISKEIYKLDVEKFFLKNKRNLFLYSTYYETCYKFKLYIILKDELSRTILPENIDKVNFVDIRRIILLNYLIENDNIIVDSVNYYQRVTLILRNNNFFKELDYNDILFINHTTKRYSTINQAVNEIIKYNI